MSGVLRADGTICLMYAGYDHFITTISNRYDHLQRRETTQQYLEFTGVTNSQFEAMISGYLRDPITQAITPTDEIRLDFDMFVGRQAAGSMEGDIVLTKDLLIQFAKDFWELRCQRPIKTQSAD